MRYWFIFLTILFRSLTVLAQENALESVKGLPTEEVFDLLADSKGFIWACHTLGVSRYDGRTLTHFNSPDQATSATSGLCEDKQGRIWCYNFNGQLFYIENEKMQLFSQYNIGDEKYFPSIVVLDSEIIVTTEKGIFVCNTATMKGRYYNTKNGSYIARSICVFRDHVITGVKNFYRYDSKNGFRAMPVGFKKGIEHNHFTQFTLLSITTRDTIYASNNSTGLLYKLIESHDSLIVVASEKIPGALNTIIKCGDSIWVNTHKLSYKLNGKDTIRSQNLTDEVKDKWGNLWYSSLQEGLRKSSFSYKGWQKIQRPFLAKGDFIRRMVSWQGKQIYGTQNGKIFIVQNDRLLGLFQLPLIAGSVEGLFVLPNKNILIAPTQGLYLANANQNKLTEISKIATLKGMTITDSSMLLAYSQMLTKISLTTHLKRNLLSSTVSADENASFEDEFKEAIRNKRLVITDTRSNLVNYDPSSKKTFAIFKFGLAELVNDSTRIILFQNKPIRAASLVQHNNKVYIGTYNIGLVILSGNHIDNISVKDGLISNTILKVKYFRNHILLVEPGYLQIWDLATKKFSHTIPLPAENVGTVYDLYEEKETVFLALRNSLYKLRLTEFVPEPPSAYLLSAIDPGSGNTIFNNASLPFDENDIQFNLSSPFYINQEATYFMYQLIGTNDTSWKRINGPLYDISYASLNSGRYRFKAYSVNFQGDRSKNTISFDFIINKPWWQQWWSILLLTVLMSAIIGLGFWQRYRNLKKRNNLVIEKLTLQNELRKSLLRTIVAQMNPHFIFNALNTIQSFVYQNDKRSVSNYMGKFSELIRKILDTSNIDSITLKEEIEILELYLDLEKARFEYDFHVELYVAKELDWEYIKIPPMFIQPCIENAIKHGLFHKKGARELKISIAYDETNNDYIRIIIDDNGIGRNRSTEINNKMHGNHRSFSSSAMENRVDLINQTLDKKITLEVIDKENDAGTTVIIRLPINSNKI